MNTAGGLTPDRLTTHNDKIYSVSRTDYPDNRFVNGGSLLSKSTTHKDKEWQLVATMALAYSVTRVQVVKAESRATSAEMVEQ